MAKNTLMDLNNLLFETLERLQDDELMADNAEVELQRARVSSTVGKTIIENGQLMLDARKHADDFAYGVDNRKMPDFLAVEYDEEK